MSTTYTASFHNGGIEENGVDSKGRKRKRLLQACREHNIREPSYCDKQEHIIKGGNHETWIDIPPEKAYEQIFGEAFKEFNSKQTKKSRKFDSYYQKVKKSKTLVPVREALITIGNCESMPDQEVQKSIYKAYVEEFKKQNPNIVVIGAYYHADEMRKNEDGTLVKGAPHLHLDYIPVAYKCERGQKVQNSMNGALIEQGIMNIEIDPGTAIKVFGLREKSKKRKKNASTQNSPEDISKRMQCLSKLENEDEKPAEKAKESRLVTNLVQWTQKQRNLLVKIASEHGLTIENPNEKKEHQSTEDYILSKNENLNSEIYSLAEKLVIGLEEMKEEKTGLTEWENDLEGREGTLDKNQKKFESDKKEHAEKVQKEKDALEYRDRVSKIKEEEAREGLKLLEAEKQNHENAKKHASERIYKVFSFLRKKKKEVEAKNKEADLKLDDALKLTQRVETLRDSTSFSYHSFADDIKFDEARLMAAKGKGKELCSWFNGLGQKFGAWLHKAQYFAKHFWNKSPDEIISVSEDMKNSFCSTLGEYIEKRMKGNTLSQIKESREIKEEISQVKKRKPSRDKGWER